MKCDVLVVGAGPSGSMAAKTVAENNIDVILIERNKTIGHPVRCAEGINNFLFQDTGIKKNGSFIDQKITGTKIYFYDEVYELTSDQWRGYTIDRTIFDKYLAQLAEKAGARIFTETKAIGLNKYNNKWKVKTNTPKGFVTIDAKIVIGADGFESNVGKWAGIKKRWNENEICKCYELLLNCPNLLGGDKFHIAFGDEFSNGYAWIFPKKKKANVGVGVRPKNNAIDALDFFINKYPGILNILNENYTIIEKRGGRIPMNGPIPVDELINDGIMLAGDAAGMVDPITGEGIESSMISGISAGETATKCIRENDWKKSNILDYQTRWMNKPYMNTTLGDNMKTLLDIKKTFHTIFSKKSTKKEREEFISMISELT